MKTIGLDFEFFDSNEKNMKVVCAVVTHESEYRKFNLLNEETVNEFKSYMKSMAENNFTILAYAAAAETRALLSLGIDPLEFNWKDLYAEFIMLCNSNNNYEYGNYIDDNGNIRYSEPPDPSLTEEEKELDTQDHSETPKNLVNALYKMLGIKVDSKHKEEMRKLILSQDIKLISDNIEEVLEYCLSDTKYLRALDVAILKAYNRLGLEDFESDQLDRGKYSVCIGICENRGIPIDLDLLNTIILKTPEILELHKGEVNAYFNYFLKEYQRPPKTFKNGEVFHYKPTPARKDSGAYQRYVESLQIPNFPKTASGKYKSDKDTLEEWGYWKGLEALWKYNKVESSLKWFNKDNKNGFFDRVGSDKNVRPFYGIFGTQTGRNAAKAKTFPLAMSSWLRAIVRPGPMHSIIGSDFSQQEVYVAAILSQDQNLLDAYNSGDVYLAFAKQAGLVPPSATKKTHKLERTLCKATVLGLQFGMGHAKLKTKLRLDSGQEVSDEKTQELIDAHKNTFSTYWQYVYNLTKSYKNGTPLCTSDGWVLWCDNKVIPSVRNFPVQAHAASITRKALVMATEYGLDVMCSLHDALYIISDNRNIKNDQNILETIMIKATSSILKQALDKCTIRIDTKVIGHQDLWVEEKGEQDIDKLSPFLGLESRLIKHTK